jgi:hypothetical protein
VVQTVEGNGTTQSQRKKKQREFPLLCKEDVNGRLPYVALASVFLVAEDRTAGSTKGSTDEGSASGIAVADVVADDGTTNGSGCGATKGSTLGVRSGCATCEEKRDGGGQAGQNLDCHGITLIGSTAWTT